MLDASPPTSRRRVGSQEEERGRGRRRQYRHRQSRTVKSKCERRERGKGGESATDRVHRSRREGRTKGEASGRAREEGSRLVDSIREWNGGALESAGELNVEILRGRERLRGDRRGQHGEGDRADGFVGEKEAGESSQRLVVLRNAASV